jgi:hypothetical protein
VIQLELKVEQSQGDTYLLEKRMELKINMMMQKLQKDVEILKQQLTDATTEVKELRSKVASLEDTQRQAPMPQMMQQPMMQPQFQQVPQQMFASQMQQQMPPMQYAQQPQQMPAQQAPPVQQGIPMSSSGSVGAAVAQQQSNMPVVDLGKMFYMGGKR